MREKLKESEINAMIEKVNFILKSELERRIDICDSIIEKYPWIKIKKPTGIHRKFAFDKVGFGNRGMLLYNNIVQQQYTHKTQIVIDFFNALGIKKQ